MKEYYAIGEASKMMGVTAQTLRNWDKCGKLKPHHIADSGYRYYSLEQINATIGLVQDAPRKVVGYCRVSNAKQKDDLDRQVECVKTYLNAQGAPYEIISDIGSGINYTKRGLKELIQKIISNQVSKVVILYKDRLLLFGFELFEYVASLFDCTIEIIDTTEKSEQQELVEDLVQIITVFSCRLHGKRANNARKIVKELIKDEDNSQSDVSAK